MNKRKNEEAPAPTEASPTDALSWQAALPFFKATRRGAQIHTGHLAHLLTRARICERQVADAEARALLADVADDCTRVLMLAQRAGRRP